MAKKIIILCMSITMILFSSISIYAAENSNETEILVNPSANATTVDMESETIAPDVDQDVKEEVVSNDDKDTKKEKAEKAKQKYKRGLAAYIRYKNGNIGREKSMNMAGYFIKYSDKYNVDEKVVMAVAQSESNFHEKSYNPAGYYGMMQASASLARANGYKPMSLLKAEAGIKVGAKYLGTLVRRYDSVSKGLAAYMYGSGTVDSGNYSRERVNKVLEKRTSIKNYLNRNNYI
ncbi:MAG: transglycosylase SLT domain-containing protein [Anaerovoracaceae bacterium]